MTPSVTEALAWADGGDPREHAAVLAAALRSALAESERMRKIVESAFPYVHHGWEGMPKVSFQNYERLVEAIRALGPEEIKRLAALSKSKEGV